MPPSENIPSENAPFLPKSDRSDVLPPDIRKLLADFKKDSNQWNLHVAERTTKKAGTIKVDGSIASPPPRSFQPLGEAIR
jgi:hypothetical protein